MSFQPYPTRSGFISLALAIISGAVATTFVNALLQQSEPPEILKSIIGLLAALGIVGLALHWTLIAMRLDYHLTRNGLAIQWGLGQQRIPFNAIKNVIPGQNLATVPSFKGINIGGLRFGRSKLAGYGLLKFRATAPINQSLLVVTTGESYVISPHQSEQFLKAWQTRRELNPTQHWTTGIQRQWPLNIPLLLDPLTWWLTGAAALLCLALFGYIAWHYPELPPALPIHFNSLGRADRIAGKDTLFILPAAGIIVWIMNTALGSLVYRWEKVGAYLLWGSAIAMQFCLWVAVLTITG